MESGVFSLNHSIPVNTEFAHIDLVRKHIKKPITYFHSIYSVLQSRQCSDHRAKHFSVSIKQFNEISIMLLE